jgi:GntR family transcriptional repressor for pyruvate dehydrogenase complex
VYERIKHDRLYEGVVAQIQERIVTGKVKPGDRLPTESELAEQFGVSRSAVREAMKILSAKGLVEITPGRGTFAKDDLADAFVETLGLFVQMEPEAIKDLHTIRNVLEVANAEMAADSRGGECIEDMAQAIETMDQTLADFDTDPLGNMERYIQADLGFHNHLARATGNSIAVILLEAIGDLLRKSRQQIFSVPGSPQKAQDFHRLILEHVRNGCPTEARVAMKQHLTQVEDDIKIAIKMMEVAR